MSAAGGDKAPGQEVRIGSKVPGVPRRLRWRAKPRIRMPVLYVVSHPKYSGFDEVEDKENLR